MLHWKEETPMPPHTSESDLANEFCTFFTQIIQTIRDYLDNPQGDGSPKFVWQDKPKFNNELSEFKSLTVDEVKKIVLKSPNKYCELDRIPTNLLRECIDGILPLLTKIINLSLQVGDMPTSLKKAIIKPMLNKLGFELINKTLQTCIQLGLSFKTNRKSSSSSVSRPLTQ